MCASTWSSDPLPAVAPQRFSCLWGWVTLSPYRPVRLRPSPASCFAAVSRVSPPLALVPSLPRLPATARRGNPNETFFPLGAFDSRRISDSVWRWPWNPAPRPGRLPQWSLIILLGTKDLCRGPPWYLERALGASPPAGPGLPVPLQSAGSQAEGCGPFGNSGFS